MKRITAIVTILSTTIACGDSSSVVTTVITTAGSDTSPTVPTSDTDDETTETSTATSDIEPTTTASSTTVDLTTSSTTDDSGPGPGEPPEYCIENEDGETSAPVTCTPVAETWCDEVAAFAGEYLPEPYLGIAIANCETAGRKDPCSVCFYIANTCQQVAGPCEYDPMMYECGCLARAHGVL